MNYMHEKKRESCVDKQKLFCRYISFWQHHIKDWIFFVCYEHSAAYSVFATVYFVLLNEKEQCLCGKKLLQDNPTDISIILLFLQPKTNSVMLCKQKAVATMGEKIWKTSFCLLFFPASIHFFFSGGLNVLVAQWLVSLCSSGDKNLLFNNKRLTFFRW